MTESEEACDACEHYSASGIDQNSGPDKVWRCDACGWLYRSVPVEGMPSYVRVLVSAKRASAAPTTEER